MSGSFTPVETANDATIVQGVIFEGQIQARDGDVNLNLHEYNGRAVTLVVMADRAEDEIASAVQRVTVTATGGTFTLEYDGDETAAIDFDETAANVELALEALDGIAPGDVVVTGDPGGPFTITFAGDLEEIGVPTIVADGAALTGPAHAIAVAVIVEGGESDAARNLAALAELSAHYA